jgi:predicted MFS family arabinose efflux permease
MAAWGTSAVVAGLVFGASPVLVVAVCLVWGITIVADSAQFSAALSELAPPGAAGSALSLQVASGFTLTALTILLVGTLDASDASGWRLAFGILALGPVVGIIAMWRLRQRPEAVRLANGRRWASYAASRSPVPLLTTVLDPVSRTRASCSSSGRLGR